jgi:hypothetical protein
MPGWAFTARRRATELAAEQLAPGDPTITPSSARILEADDGYAGVHPLLPGARAAIPLERPAQRVRGTSGQRRYHSIALAPRGGSGDMRPRRSPWRSRGATPGSVGRCCS